ncbi:apoptotic chromatin condensation inducer in the nucleus-like [Haliotis cracherodii]|uniref:apoptotic chromatin condensation inducer in the nucleus-like n=1 Tax=Haliotis cracherodii TaxID=6455 RepID=UPI0039EC67E3
MSACFQKHVGKQGKRKKAEDSDSDVAAPTASTHTDEVVISDDSNGHGRTDRLKKRRKRIEHAVKDEELEKAEHLIQNDFGIPVDAGMPRQEVIELAMVLLQSREYRAQSTNADKARSPKQYSTSQSRRSTSDEDLLDLDIPSSSRREGKKSPILNKSPEPSTSFADEDGIGLSLKRTSRRKASAEVEAEAYKDDPGDSSPDEVMGGSRDAGDDDEREPPSTRNQRKIDSEKRQRKRRLTDEAAGDESPSSQEADSANTRLKKSRNLQLNKQQLETMQAKTSTLLKKSAAKVKFSQETAGSSGSQPNQVMEDDIDETQAPGSQELFEGETIPMDLPGTPVSDEEADQHKGRTRALRSAGKKGTVAENDSHLSPLIPMKRRYSKAALLRRSQENDFSKRSFFAPVSADHIAYTKVIIQLFDIYFRKLSKEQVKADSYIEWGESVKPGRHMTRTIDAKGRGQKSYSWSSESDEEVTIRLDKSSDEGVESGEGRLRMKSRTGERSLRATKSRKVVHNSNSPDSPKSSETDVNEHKRIQPRRIIPTRRDPLDASNEDEDEESLPDIGISSSDKPPEAGQCRYSEDTQTDSPVYPTLVPQTLAMEEDLYMADTETFEPELTEVQSRDSDSPMEIQPRKTIVNSPTEIQKRRTIKRPDDLKESDSSDLATEILRRRSLRKSSPSTVTCSQDTRRDSVSLSPKLPGSQASSGSRESGSLINSQGEIKSFQKARPGKTGTFNFDIDEDDSKDSDVGGFVTKRKPAVSPRQVVGSSLSVSERRTQRDVQDKSVRGKEEPTIDIVSSDSNEGSPGKERLASPHESPILSVRRSGHTFTRKKRSSMTTTRQEATLDGFFVKDNSDFVTNRIGLKVRNLSPDSKQPSRASTSKDRIIPIILTDTYEKESTSADSSPEKAKSLRSELHFADSDDSGDVVQSGPELDTEGKIQCPMCSKLFRVNLIERHASDCLGQQEVTSTTGDDGNLQASTSTRSRHQESDKGDYSGRTRIAKEQGDVVEEPIPITVKPILQSRHMEQCCVCNMLVRQDLIEKHTEQCIAARMQQAERGDQDVLDLELEADEPERRATRSRGRGHQTPSGMRPNIKHRLLEEEADSLSSETSDNHDPDWTAASTTTEVESESPMKFKKISQLDEAELDFKNQFKSKAAGKGGKRGGTSRGRGRR